MSDGQEMELKTALEEAAKAVARIKEACGQSPRGRQAAIVATEIEKLLALRQYYDL